MDNRYKGRDREKEEPVLHQNRNRRHYRLIVEQDRPFNGDRSCSQCNIGTETSHLLLCEYGALDHRSQTIYGQIKLSPRVYDKHLSKDLYRRVQGTTMLQGNWNIEEMDKAGSSQKEKQLCLF